jgi:hypothetical protein
VKDTIELITRYIHTHPIDVKSIIIDDINRNGRWVINVQQECVLQALETFLTAEHAIVSNITTDSTKQKYIVTVPYTIGTMRYGAYTYNKEKNILE